jgi:hypothetical protein
MSIGKRIAQRKSRRKLLGMRNVGLVLALLLAGCALMEASKEFAAVPGKNQPAELVTTDTLACEAKAKAYKEEHSTGAVIGGGWLLGPLANHNGYQRTYVECMTARGYTIKD